MVDLFKLATPAEPRANVLFVHGLGGDPYGTWRCGKNRGNDWKECDPTFWPIWLAHDCEVAVYVIGYDTPISRWRGSTLHFTDQADNLLARILAESALKRRRLIFIGHSLGGLLIKQLLRSANETAQFEADAAHLIDHVHQVIFMATPHSGSTAATWADRLRILVRPSAATASLARNDPNLRNLNTWYRRWATHRGIGHLILKEGKPAPIVGMVVAFDSADPGLPNAKMIPLNTSHTGICKPRDRHNEIYIYVKDFIDQGIRRQTSTLPPSDMSSATPVPLTDSSSPIEMKPLSDDTKKKR
jgi:pimeloyl-ACP methyl ester carboxylesterase